MKPIKGSVIVVYQCPKCKTNMRTEHTSASEFEMRMPDGHWASVKKLKWEGQCPTCFEWCEVVI